MMPHSADAEAGTAAAAGAPAGVAASTDSITLTGLRVRAHHGVFDFERENGQDFVVDVTVWLDLGPAARGDALAATVHYGELAIAVHDAVAGDPVDLIETVAERVARVALGFETADRVAVAVHKPDAPIPVPFTDVVVRIERDRAWFERDREVQHPSAVASVDRDSAVVVPEAFAPEVVVPAVVALGSNLGARAELLVDAVAALRTTPGIEVTAVSPIVESVALKPDGRDDEAPRYYNAVVAIETVLPPRELLAALNAIEAEHGRVRAERWGDRTLDLDIVDYDGRVSDDPVVTLPHPRAHERDFVLAPWLSIDVDATLPGHGRIDALLSVVGNGTSPVAGVAP